MTTYLITMAILYALGIMSRVFDLASGRIKAPTPFVVATGICVSLAFLVWTLYLLADA